MKKGLGVTIATDERVDSLCSNALTVEKVSCPQASYL